MFPVPNHLQKGGMDTEVSRSKRKDPVVDLLAPLFEKQGSTSKNARLPVKDVTRVREEFEQSVKSNKSRGHQLVVDNFPSISSHIRLGSELRGDFGKLQRSVAEVESQLDISDHETSFLPPVLSLLDRHLSAVQAKERAQAHTVALESLGNHVKRVKSLEDAVQSGRGADVEVVDALQSKDGRFAVEQQEVSSQEVLFQLKAFQAAHARLEVLRSLVIGQITDAFSKAVVFVESKTRQQGLSLNVSQNVQLQKPAQPKLVDVESVARPSVPMTYTLSQISNSLSAFSSVDPILSTLQSRLVKDIVEPVFKDGAGIEVKTVDSTSTLRLTKADPTRAPSATLEDISTVLSFVSNAIFPAEGEVFVGRSTFLATLHQIVFGLVLERLILPNMPSDLDATQGWLETVAQAVQIERQHSQTIEAQGQAIIEPFFVEEAGKAWANAKRRVNAEAVRKLILGGWLGWESRQAEREKELVMVVEVEVEEEDLRNNQEPSGTRSHSGESRRKEVANGWGLDEEQSQKTDKSPDDGINDDSMDVEEGWGFEGEHEAGPSSPKRPSDTTGLSSTDELDEEEGWDFEDPVAAPSQPAIEPPAPIIASKPAREAKRLGKKVAKVKAQVDDDPWGSGSESLPPSHDTTDVEPSPVVPQISRVATPSNAQEAPRSPAPPSHSAPAVPRSKRKELREEKRTIRETFLVSRACDQLLKSAESSLRESEDLKATSVSSPSFSQAYSTLLDSASDIFDIHRSLLPAHFASNLRDVPTLSMQLHNDAQHLANAVSELAKSSPSWTAAEGIVARLNALAEHAFEAQLIGQRESMMEALDEAGDFKDIGSDNGFRLCERAMSGLVHNIDSLSRVLKVVLPTTTYLGVLGYLLDESVQRVTTDVLNLMDITEVESNRLNDLLKLIRPLEEIFRMDPEQPSTVVAHVPHWLKFCYTSELLQANLVDILYLHDNGALIDFSTAELVGLIRALFADSEKRDNAIERIERGVPAQTQ